MSIEIKITLKGNIRNLRLSILSFYNLNVIQVHQLFWMHDNIYHVKKLDSYINHSPLQSKHNTIYDKITNKHINIHFNIIVLFTYNTND